MAKITKAVHECLRFRKSSLISFDLKMTQRDEGGVRPRLQKKRLIFQEVK